MKENKKLYHFDVYMPQHIKDLFPKGYVKSLVYSKHAGDRCIEKNIDLLDAINLRYFTVVELEITNNSWSKAVVKSNTPDIKGNCLHLVIIPTNYDHIVVVKTVWNNFHKDTHKTMNLNLYEREVN